MTIRAMTCRGQRRQRHGGSRNNNNNNSGGEEPGPITSVFHHHRGPRTATAAAGLRPSSTHPIPSSQRGENCNNRNHLRKNGGHNSNRAATASAQVRGVGSEEKLALPPPSSLSSSSSVSPSTAAAAAASRLNPRTRGNGKENSCPGNSSIRGGGTAAATPEDGVDPSDETASWSGTLASRSDSWGAGAVHSECGSIGGRSVSESRGGGR